jgi:hypothetical protein
LDVVLWFDQDVAGQPGITVPIPGMVFESDLMFHMLFKSVPGRSQERAREKIGKTHCSAITPGFFSETLRSSRVCGRVRCGEDSLGQRWNVAYGSDSEGVAGGWRDRCSRDDADPKLRGFTDFMANNSFRLKPEHQDYRPGLLLGHEG